MANKRKQKQFLQQAEENQKDFELHRELIEKHLCYGGKTYHKDLQTFADTQRVESHLLLRLIQYAEDYHLLTLKKVR